MEYMNKRVIRLAGAVIIAMLAYAAISLNQGSRTLIAIILGVPSFILMNISRIQLGKSFAVMPRAKALVTAGLYSRIQHPLYFFLDIFLIGVIVFIGWPILLLVWGILVVMQTLQSAREEHILLAAFGADYGAYTRRTWF